MCIPVPCHVLCCLLGLLAVSGCGGSSLPTVPVTGTVKYNEQAVEGASVVFVDKKPDGKSAAGVTDAQGNFTLTTSLGGSKVASGALPADYVVLISKAAAPAGPTVPTDESLTEPVPVTGSGGQMSEEQVKKMMAAGNSKGTDINALLPVNQQQAKALLPADYSDPAKSGLTASVKKGEKNHFDFNLKD